MGLNVVFYWHRETALRSLIDLDYFWSVFQDSSFMSPLQC